MNSLFDSSRRTGRRSRRHASCPQAEVLEARSLLAALAITEFPVPTPMFDSGLVGITAGFDGNLWFTDQGGTFGVPDRIGRITPSGAVTEYPLPTPIRDLSGIAAGPDKNLWFTEAYANKIGRITPSGVITEFDLPPNNQSAHPTGITAGADGNLWFTESGESALNGDIGRITPSGVITLFPLPTRPFPPARDLGTGITLGSNGNVWFTEHRFGSNNDLIGEITPEGVITEFDLPGPNSYPTGITAGPDGNLWFTEDTFNIARIGRITPGGTVTEFPLPSQSSGPRGIVTGPDGNLWFTESDGKVGRITPSGTITEFPLPGHGSAYEITVGPNNTLWLTEQASPSLIGKISFQGLPSVTTVDDALQGTGLDQFHYVGSWTNVTHTTIPNAFNGGVSITSTADDTVTITFTGTQVKYYAAERNNRGKAAVSIDSGPETIVDEFVPSSAGVGDVLVYTSPTLAPGTHTLTIRNTGQKNARSSGTIVDVDRVDILA
jgi:streptogramin lyase